MPTTNFAKKEKIFFSPKKKSSQVLFLAMDPDWTKMLDPSIRIDNPCLINYMYLNSLGTPLWKPANVS
jgi:hypothetical protein